MKLGKKSTQEKNKEIQDIENVNILIVGKTGAGKSTLINSIFREDMAKTGVGEPVTQNLEKISKYGVPLTLYDTKGLELNEEIQDEIKKEILGEIRKCKNNSLYKNNASELIHVCWYCISSPRARCEDTDREWIKDISKEMPVIVVITKGYPKNSANNFMVEIESYDLDCKSIVPVLAQGHKEFDEESNEYYNIPAYGLETLVEETLKVLPQEIGQSFSNAQKISVKHKVLEARKWMMAYVGGSGVIGLSPIPFSDAPLLAASQLSMLAHITKIFGLPIDKTFLTELISSVLGISLASILGKTLVSNALKFFPGIGTVAGGAISASVAILLTTTLGMAYINVLKYKLEEEAKGNIISTDRIVERMKMEFKNEMNLNKNKK